MTSKAAAIIPAAGIGRRMKGACPKQYLDLAGKPILVHTVSTFHHHEKIARIIVVAPEERREETAAMLAAWKINGKTVVVAGGKRRQDSVKAGLDALDESFDIVLVHDGARPLITGELISRCYLEAQKSGAAIAAIPVKDTLKRCSAAGIILKTVNRDNLWQAQTPQAARLSLLRRAFSENGDENVTDEASLFEKAGIPVTIVAGSETNMKITHPEDILIADKILGQNLAERIRIGHGYDAHQLVTGRALVLGGVTIPHPLGLAGHSDADVVTHALCDAILGALGSGDIGRHFPDTSAEFKDISSLRLLERVSEAMLTAGFQLGNADISIICQSPKLAPYSRVMRQNLARSCKTEEESINIKATTTEKMGFTGREEGISCHAVVIIGKIL